MICTKDAFWSGVTQTHAVLFFLILDHQNVALNGGYSRECGQQTANEPLQYQVCVVNSVPIILVRVAVVKSVNGDLHFMLVAVCVAQGLELAPNIANVLYAESIVETLPVALQIYGEVAGKNIDKMMG